MQIFVTNKQGTYVISDINLSRWRCTQKWVTW